MKILFMLLIFMTSEVFALEAVVTVLEAPMFKSKSLDSHVVQYLRKGDVIKVHPALGNTTKYDHLAPSNKAINEQEVYIEDQFIPTLSRQGHTVYVLSEHIYVYFNDSRELTQSIDKRDPTDYRLEEPLPKNYPLTTPSGIRGLMLLGFSQPYNQSYDYPDQVKSKSYVAPLELNLIFLKRVPYDQQDRFYFGGNFQFKTFENAYSFFDFRTSRERYFQLGAGPLISYDAYKGEKNRINLSASINFNPYIHLTVTQSNETANDSRLYRAFNFSSRIGLQYHRKNIHDELDFVLGTSLDVEPPATFQAQTAGQEQEWWQKIGGDKFRTRGFASLSGFIGVQTAY